VFGNELQGMRKNYGELYPLVIIYMYDDQTPLCFFIIICFSVRYIYIIIYTYIIKFYCTRE